SVSVIYDMTYIFFFFQAEDGIRDWSVTGVQTCALPISRHSSSTAAPGSTCTTSCCGRPSSARASATRRSAPAATCLTIPRPCVRSEERRVGKEGGYRGGRDE